MELPGKTWGFTLDVKGGKGTQAINNRFSNDNQAGRTFNFTVEDGKSNIKNGIQEVDFVIDMDGNLHIGRGHSNLANGNSIQAMNFPDIFTSAGLIVDNTGISMSDLSTSMSNYVISADIFYNGPVQYMPGQRKGNVWKKWEKWIKHY